MTGPKYAPAKQRNVNVMCFQRRRQSEGISYYLLKLEPLLEISLLALSNVALLHNNWGKVHPVEEEQYVISSAKNKTLQGFGDEVDIRTIN